MKKQDTGTQEHSAEAQSTEHEPTADGGEAAEAQNGQPAPSETTETEDDATAAGAQAVEAAALKAEREELNARLLRQAAEFQNYRRRSEEEKSRLITATKARTIEPMLGILDDFERTMEAAAQFDDAESAEKAYAALREGVELLLKKLRDELARLGVEPIEAKGQPFNEAEHEALMQQPAPEDTAPGTVLEEVQKGYRMGERVLRHSKVIVAAEQ